jgi:hypothetical protein
MSLILGASPGVHVVTVRRPDADVGPCLGPRVHRTGVHANPSEHGVHQVPNWDGSNRLGTPNGHAVHTPRSGGQQ